MQKRAESQFDIMPEVAERWSPRAFDERMVEGEKLGALFAAAQWSASCFNEQPWRFIVATKERPEDYDRMLSCLVEGNQSWARQAPVLAICLASECFARNDKPNRHAWHDLGIASGALSLQATHLGLFTHFMAGIQHDRIEELFALPNGFTPATGLAIGYMGDAQSLPENFREKEAAPRTRKSLDELVFGGQWARPFEF